MIIMHSCGINNNWLMFHVEQINKSRKMFYVEQSRGEQKRALWPFETVEKVAFSHFFDTLTPPVYAWGVSLSKNPRVDKGPQPLMFNPALTTCASERMKTQRFSYFADFAARERMREAKPVKLKKVAFSHFFDTLQ